jgi:hypothetical protein
LNYDKSIELTPSVEIESTSNIYLTVETNAEIKSLKVDGLLYIRGEEESENTYTLEVGSSSTPIAIQCGSFRIGNDKVKLTLSASSYGIKSSSFVDVSRGTLTVNGGASAYAIQADSFVSLDNASLTINSGYGILAASLFAMNGGTLNVTTNQDGVNAQYIYIRNNANATVVSSAAYGVKSRENILVEFQSSLSGKGSTVGVFTDGGFIKVNNATVTGNGTSGTYPSVSATGGIYTINGGVIAGSGSTTEPTVLTPNH